MTAHCVQVLGSEQLKQLVGQEKHLPFNSTLPEPQAVRHIPEFRVTPVGQEVQLLEPACEQVAQEESQGVQSWKLPKKPALQSQVWVTEL